MDKNELKRLLELAKETDSYYLIRRGIAKNYNPTGPYNLMHGRIALIRHRGITTSTFTRRGYILTRSRIFLKQWGHLRKSIKSLVRLENENMFDDGS